MRVGLAGWLCETGAALQQHFNVKVGFVGLLLASMSQMACCAPKTKKT